MGYRPPVLPPGLRNQQAPLWNQSLARWTPIDAWFPSWWNRYQYSSVASSALHTGSPVTYGSLSTGNPTASLLRAYPFITSRRINIVRIGVVGTTNTPGNGCRVGIYDNASDARCYPNKLVSTANGYDGNTDSAIVCSSIGTQLATINVNLAPGVYWLASVFSISLTPAMNMLQPTQIEPIMGQLDGGATAVPVVGTSLTSSHGVTALSSTFPASAGLSTANAAAVYFGLGVYPT